MSHFKLEDIKRAMVVGAGHGIGYSVVSLLLKEYPQVQVTASFRISEKAEALFTLQKQFPDRLTVLSLDPTEESQVSQLSKEVSGELDLIFNAVGMLREGRFGPEKKLEEIDKAFMQRSFEVNVLSSVLIAKHFLGLFPRDRLSAFVALSAKVGSISDNQLGGWYSYRMSKAALNMFLKTLSVEARLRKRKIMSLAIHPGTTRTELSQGFVERTKLKVHSPEQTAKNILNVIQGRSLEDTGKFFSWDGTKLEW